MQMIIPEPSVGNLSDAFFNRLLDFFHRSTRNVRATSDIWKVMEIQFQQPLVSALQAGDSLGLKTVLAGLFNYEIVHGLDQPNSSYGPYRESYMPFWESQMLQVGIGLGVFPVWCDVLQQRPRPVLETGEAYKMICKHLGFSLHQPMVGARHGVQCNLDFVPLKTWQFLWPWKTIRILRPHARRVLEIGGGLGGFAQLSVLSGVEQHVVIDLPVMSVMSAFFTAAMFGEERIVLDGEEYDPIRHVVAYVLPENSAAGDRIELFDVVFNMDSGPEIPIPQLHDYLVLTEIALRPGGILVSNNHEDGFDGQHPLVAVMDRQVKISTSLQKISRNPFPLRNGYVEEVWMKE